MNGFPRGEIARSQSGTDGLLLVNMKGSQGHSTDG